MEFGKAAFADIIKTGVTTGATAVGAAISSPIGGIVAGSVVAIYAGGEAEKFKQTLKKNKQKG